MSERLKLQDSEVAFRATAARLPLGARLLQVPVHNGRVVLGLVPWPSPTCWIANLSFAEAAHQLAGPGGSEH